MSTTIPQYPFDPTGVAVTNLVTETQAIQSRGMFDHYYIVPRSGPFYAESVRLRLYPAGANVNNPLGGTLLQEGEHFNFGYHFAHASHTIGKPIYGAISFYDRALAGQLRMEYQTIGGEWVLDHQAMAELLANVTQNPRIATWEQLVELPHQFPVVNHDFNIDDFVGMSEVEDRLGDIERAIVQKNEGGMVDHVNDKANPHEVNKFQVGLGLVDNYATAAPAEAESGTLNTRFMTPLRTRQAIEAIAISALNAHMNDTNNPHQTTKAQVGLSNVQNYAVASQAEAEAGASNARFMTPARTREAIVAIVQTAFLAHAANTSNPHNVTRAQVGLGNVPNIGIATDADAIAGNNDNGIITPRLLALVMSETLGDGVADHISNDQNPHGTTKAQVGLEFVMNYPVATQAEAEDATLDNRYMTPLATRRTINALVGDMSNAHVSDLDNPHQVTAAQVGAYSIEIMDALLANKLDDNAVAADAAMVYGLDQEALEGWIGTILSGDSIKFDGKTLAEVKAEILAGKAADSAKLDGKTYNEVLTEISQLVDGGSIQFTIPAIVELDDEFGDLVVPGDHWINIGKIFPDLLTSQGDITFLITGGRDDTAFGDVKHHTALVEISAVRDRIDGQGDQLIVVKSLLLKELTPVDNPFQIGVRSVGANTTSELEIWLKANGPRNELTITELSNRGFISIPVVAPVAIADLVTEEPVGLVYCPHLKEGSQEINQLIAFSQRTDNPHQVTKAQVGLGSVSNYPNASNAEAIAGVATNRFMTPATTAAKVDNAIDTLCDELGVVIDDALANYFA